MQADTFGGGHMKGRKVFPVTIAKSRTLSTVRPPNMAQSTILICLVIFLKTNDHNNGIGDSLVDLGI